MDNAKTPTIIELLQNAFLLESIGDLSRALEEQRKRDRRIFDSTAIAVRRLIVAAIRKGYCHVGGREAIDGLRNDLIQFGILTVSDKVRLNTTLNDCYDRAYEVGVATEAMGGNTEADWRIEMFKAVCEAKTLKAIYGVEVKDAPEAGGGS